MNKTTTTVIYTSTLESYDAPTQGCITMVIIKYNDNNNDFLTLPLDDHVIQTNITANKSMSQLISFTPKLSLNL